MMRFNNAVLLILIASSFSVSSVFCTEIPGLKPSSAVIELSNMELPLEKETFISGALLLSGADQDTLDKGFRKILELQALADQELKGINNYYDLGHKLLEFLHEHLFKKYSVEQTRIDILLENGVYNCVSSAVIYIYFSRYFGLPVTGSVTIDHAFCSLLVNDEIIDIETTNKYGFDPGKKQNFLDSFGNITGFAYVPPTDYKNRSYANDLEMLSYIIQNRLVLLQRSNRYDITYPLAVDKYFLVNTENARLDMFQEFVNYMIAMNNSGNYISGLQFAEKVIEEYRGDISLIQDSIDMLLRNYALDILGSGSPDGVYDMLKKYGSLAGDETYREIKKTVLTKEIYDLALSDQYTSAISLADDVHKENVIDDSEYSEFISLIYTNSSVNIVKEQGSLAGYYHILEGIGITGSTRELQSALSVHKNNAILEFHNKFVVEYNSGHLDKAESVLHEGLDIFPDSRILTNDLSYFE